MVYPLPPTVDDLTERFPIFADADEDALQRCLDEAIATVDQTWRELDYRPAILYLAAHLFATDNSGAGEEVEFGSKAGPITSESFPGMSVSYATKSAQPGDLASSDAYGSTEYGRRYLRLLKANRPGPVVI